MKFLPSPAVCALVLAVGACMISCPAQSMLAPPFTDHAVLQRDVAIPVWGQASPGENITVQFRGQIRTATTAKLDGDILAG